MAVAAYMFIAWWFFDYQKVVGPVEMGLVGISIILIQWIWKRLPRLEE